MMASSVLRFGWNVGMFINNLSRKWRKLGQSDVYSLSLGFSCMIPWPLSQREPGFTVCSIHKRILTFCEAAEIRLICGDSLSCVIIPGLLDVLQARHTIKLNTRKCVPASVTPLCMLAISGITWRCVGNQGWKGLLQVTNNSTTL